MRASRSLAISLTVLSALYALTARAEDRVAEARKRGGLQIRMRFAKAGVAYPPGQVYLRAFKRERELELWAGDKGEAALHLIHTYPICSASGGLGPKRAMGDGQVPEGFYELDRFNPVSNFHLSLRVSYPNPSDSRRGVPRSLGGDIYLHGNCVSIGCIAIEDVPIEEVYLALLDAREAGVRRFPIHIFPQRLDPESWKQLQERARKRPELIAFWEELLPGFTAFEQSHQVPKVRIDPATGSYRVETR